MGAGRGMAADMGEQPAVLAALAGRRESVLAELRAALPAEPAGVVLVARGSSDYAAVFGRYVLETAVRRPVALAAPSLQTLYGVEPDLRGWLAVGVSQSGRTPEIVTVLERLAHAGACPVAFTNDPESPLAAVARAEIPLGAGDERAVPATKTFTSELVAFALLAEALGPVPWTGADVDGLAPAVAELLEDSGRVEGAVARLGAAEEMVCLARGYLLCVALEAALKLREAARVRAEGWSAADFRHGPITVAAADLPVLAFSAEGPAAADVDELAERLASDGGTVLRASDRPGADLSLPPAVPEPLMAVAAAVRAQQLALSLARHRGLDPDAPAGLAKVTPTR
jgi:glutamine---fructose-6-phosphate transaminase (isomerizing)